MPACCSAWKALRRCGTPPTPSPDPSFRPSERSEGAEEAPERGRHSHRSKAKEHFAKGEPIAFLRGPVPSRLVAPSASRDETVPGRFPFLPSFRPSERSEGAEEAPERERYSHRSEAKEHFAKGQPIALRRREPPSRSYEVQSHRAWWHRCHLPAPAAAFSRAGGSPRESASRPAWGPLGMESVEAPLPGAPAASFYSQRMLRAGFPRSATPELVLLRDETPHRCSAQLQEWHLPSGGSFSLAVFLWVLPGVGWSWPRYLGAWESDD